MVARLSEQLMWELEHTLLRSSSQEQQIAKLPDGTVCCTQGDDNAQTSRQA
jgi:hypothetical protein